MSLGSHSTQTTKGDKMYGKGIDRTNMLVLRRSVEALQKEVYTTAKEHGWWEGPQNKGEKIALMHSELSEVLEALRKGGGQSEKIPEFTKEEEELADCIIRILDYAGHYKLELAGAILAKMEYNVHRPYKHGKKF